GKDGLPGKDGKDGQDGKDGLPGKDGQPGKPAPKTPAAHDTHRQLPATGETTNPFFTAAAVAIMTTAGVVAVAKRQENN
ncbi:TPA: LPXTG cell wall anchor domain-containing protein, partial [Streptococcus pyogenes]|nr:LPXTG cell wall anchor domain-containing protein [Streptococcus pyogenes]